MSVVLQDFETGTGTMAADADSGFSLVAIGAGGLTYDTAHAKHGTKSMKVVAVSGVATYGQKSGLNAPRFADSFYFWVDSATPAADQYLFSLFDTSLGTVCKVVLRSTGKLALQLTSATNIYQSASNVPTGQWVRVDLYVANSVDGVSGTIKLDYYLGDSTTPVEAGYSSVGAAATGSLNLDQFRLGKGNASTGANVVWYDVNRYDNAATDKLGPYSPTNALPTATITANQDKAAGAATTATVSASDSDGTIASYAWTVAYSSDPAFDNTDLTGASTATVSLTAPAAGHLVILQCVVTDNDGGTVTKTTEVRVPLATDFTTLPASGAGAGWLDFGGAGSGGAALADALDSTYVESFTFSATASARRWRLQPLTSRSTLTLTSRTLLTTLGGTVKVRLREGITAQTLRQEWDVTQGTSFADQALAVTSPGSISDWGDLWIEYSVAT